MKSTSRPSLAAISMVLVAAIAMASANVAFAQAGATTQPAAVPAPAPGAAEGKAGRHKGEAKLDRTKDHDAKLIEDATADLNLTADQKKQIAALMSDYANARKTWAAQNQSELSQLRDKAKAARDTKDTSSARTAGQQLKTLEASAPQFKVTMLKVREVLTPEQQARFDVKMLEKTGSGTPGNRKTTKADGTPKPVKEGGRRSKPAAQ
ncbi:MAG: Spy/CpxP family protein refolding chaperone [Planctomycetota bacterium]|nr:Spy/CpxP family protein refolding chaperone [Planctomycetota bacterium]